jgi:hypothetical protein
MMRTAIISYLMLASNYICAMVVVFSSSDNYFRHYFDRLQRNRRIKHMNIYVAEINFQIFSLSSWECLDTSIMTKRLPTFRLDGKKDELNRNEKRKYINILANLFFILFFVTYKQSEHNLPEFGKKNKTR